MDNVDTKRMERVLQRLYPPDRPPEREQRRGPPTACILLSREERLRQLTRELMGRSGECRRALQPLLRQSGVRAGHLRPDCYLDRGRPGRDRPPRRLPGVLSGLRELYRMLEGLAEEYEKAAAEMPRRFGYCESFARECRNGTETVHRLLRRAMGEENRTDAE